MRRKELNPFAVASHLESQIRAHTQVLQILDLQRSFINLDAPLLAPGRRLVKAGGLRKLDRRGNDQMRTFFLFNDIFIHASGGESGSWGGLSGTEALESRARNQPSGTAATSQAGGPAQYCFHRRFALEGITVVDVQDATEQGRRYGFEILSSEKSFAVYAGTFSFVSHVGVSLTSVASETLTEKLDWIDEIRGAIAELMSDRRTLQREADSEALRRDRRISLPASPSAPNLRPLAFRTQTTPLPPALGFIPPTPLDERDGLLADSPGVFDQAFEFPTQGVDLDSPTLESDGRTRRCSDMAPSTAARALSEALPAETEEPVVEYRVIENYSAPVWVPDSKADRCMCCSSQFGVLRRRHHCRLCGAVVCWSCSTKVSSLAVVRFVEKLADCDCRASSFPPTTKAVPIDWLALATAAAKPSLARRPNPRPARRPRTSIRAPTSTRLNLDRAASRGSTSRCQGSASMRVPNSRKKGGRRRRWPSWLPS